MKVLIVPDKFKGTLTAGEAAQAIARGWKRVRPSDPLELLPMSDGGDGFGEIMSSLLDADVQSARTVDAAHRPCDATWWWHGASATAIIESARVIGLAQLPRGKYHPFELDTEGLGAVLQDAAKAGARRCIVGVGGSATNDGGFGMARALGWGFFDSRGGKIVRWTELRNLAQVRPPPETRLFEELTVAVDVENPLLGPRGCSRIYGPQKGLHPDDLDFAERCLEQLVAVLKSELHLDHSCEPGTGAAGGLGFGLRSFLGAAISPGFDLFAGQARLHDRIRQADLVISAEGAIDQQTLMGKGVGQIANLCCGLNVRCIALAGVIEAPDAAAKSFYKAAALVDLTSAVEAMKNAAHWLEELALKVAGQIEV